jgi:hypothetical protein
MSSVLISVLTTLSILKLPAGWEPLGPMSDALLQPEPQGWSCLTPSAVTCSQPCLPLRRASWGCLCQLLLAFASCLFSKPGMSSARVRPVWRRPWAGDYRMKHLGSAQVSHLSTGHSQPQSDLWDWFSWALWLQALSSQVTLHACLFHGNPWHLLCWPSPRWSLFPHKLPRTLPHTHTPSFCSQEPKLLFP